jgi:hypothetical protein
MAWRNGAATRAALLQAALIAMSYFGVDTAIAAERHSGRVVAVSDAGQRLTLETVGPWQGAGRGIRTIDVIVDRGTRLTRVHRREGFGPGGWPGGFASEPVSARAIGVGDFVTVQVVWAQGEARALAIEVLDDEATARTCAPDELLVGFARAPSHEAATALYGRWHAMLIETIRGLPVHRVRIPPERRADAARALALHPDVRFVERNCQRALASAGGA